MASKVSSARREKSVKKSASIPLKITKRDLKRIEKTIKILLAIYPVDIVQLELRMTKEGLIATGNLMFDIG